MHAPEPNRKTLTFSQAEGLAPLPTPLALKQMSQQLRSLLWSVVHSDIKQEMETENRIHTVGGRWRQVLADKHVVLDHRMADEYSSEVSSNIPQLKEVFTKGTYAKIFDLLQFMMRHPRIRADFAVRIERAFRTGHAAYGVVDSDTIIPLATPEEGAALNTALKDLADGPFKGARTHLKSAAERLNEGAWADSIRESISAVEAVARVWEPTANSLDPALRSLGRTHRLHPALSAGFGKLYGFTNDENGIRHALLDTAAPAVDEADAVYMLGACASFTSYLIRRHREAQTASTHEQG